MEIVVDEGKRIVEMWLSRAEKSDTRLRESLKPIYAKYKSHKYLVVVYESGTKDLFANTRDLILSNREQLAKVSSNVYP